MKEIDFYMFEDFNKKELLYFLRTIISFLSYNE